MIVYRMIVANEVEQMADFAIEGMQAHRYPLHVQRSKVVATIDAVRTSRLHFGLAAIDESGIQGAIAALVCELPFFERREAHVIMCRAVVPGVGRRLIKALREWTDSNIMIRRVVFPMEEHADQRMARLLARYGFDRPQVNAVYYKG